MELSVLPGQLQRSFMIAGSLPLILAFFITAKEHIKSMNCSCLLMTLKYRGLVREKCQLEKIFLQNMGAGHKLVFPEFNLNVLGMRTKMKCG